MLRRFGMAVVSTFAFMLLLSPECKSQSTNQDAATLLQAYRYAFRQAGISPTGTLQNLNLNTEQQAQFQQAASDYMLTQTRIQNQINTVIERDWASHPQTTHLTALARASIRTIFGSLTRNETVLVDLIHQNLDATTVRQMDEAVVALYSNEKQNSPPSGTLIANHRTASTRSILRFNGTILQESGSAHPMVAPGGGGNYCSELTADEEDAEDEECADEGGEYDLENCTCYDSSGDGGGGGGGDPTPIITGDYHDLWYFGNGITQQSKGATAFMYKVTLTAYGDGTAVWNIVSGQNEITLTSNGNTATITSSGNSFSSNVGDVSITVTMNGQTSSPWTITTHTPYRMIAGTHDHACDSSWGYSDVIHYTVQDQLNNSLSIYLFDFNELFTTAFTNVNGSNWGTPPQEPATNSDIEDHITGVGVNNSPTPVPMPVCSGNDTEAQYVTQQWRVGSLTAGSGVLLQTDQLARYADKGMHNNIVPVHQ